MRKIYLLMNFCLLVQTMNAQYQIGIIPRVSPDKMVYQKIGYTEVEIKYGSPSVKNRSIFGDLVPYDKVWRAGANSATTVEFKSAVKIDGMTLDSGKYALFLIPRENDKWIAIFNKKAKQWGAFRYNREEDALRVEVSPRLTPFKTEHLTYNINQTGFKYGSIACSWDFATVEIPFETNYLNEFEEEIESRASLQPKYIKWIPYIQGAEHLETIQDSLNLAKKWIDLAEKIMDTTEEWNKQFYPRSYVKGHLYWTKAKILAWNNEYKEAIKYVEKLKELSQALYYNRKKEKEGIDEFYLSWKKKVESDK